MKRGLAGLLCASAVVATGCPDPLPPIEDPDAFELEIPPQPLQGLVEDEPWSLLQSFAFDEGEGRYVIAFAPAPVTACEASTSDDEGVLTVEITQFGLQPWGPDAFNEITLPEGRSLSTEGGGIEIDLDPGGTNLVGGMIFDFDPRTKLEGEFTVPLCP